MTDTPPRPTWPPQSSDDDLVHEPHQRTSTGVSRRQITYAVIAVLGVLAGLGLGLFYTWQVDPVIEQNTRPDQLNETDKNRYVIAIALDYGSTGDLTRAYNLLGQVEPGSDPFQVAADTLCEMTLSGQVQTASDIQAMRNLIAIAEPQDVDLNCDISLYATSAPPTVVTLAPTVTPSPTVPPIATKTPTVSGPSPTPLVADASPTPATSRNEFVIAATSPFCDPNRDGIIIVQVRDRNGFPLPGIEVMVTWNDENGQQEDRFFTGLKPDINEGYADFQMEPGETYQVGLVGRSNLSNPLEARQSCGESGTLSYEVVIQPR